jgi:hypothetical protein
MKVLHDSIKTSKNLMLSMENITFPKSQKKLIDPIIVSFSQESPLYQISDINRLLAILLDAIITPF